MTTGEPTPTTCILSLGGGPSGAEMVLISKGAAPVVTSMDVILLDQAQDAIAVMETPAAGLLLPGHDLVMRRAERRGAELLWQLLIQGDLGPRLHQLCGLALGAGVPLRLCLDIGTQQLRSLPWELLGGLAQKDLGVSIEVLRLRPGTQSRAQAAAPKAGGVDILLWTPDGEDPVCRQVGARLALGLGDASNLRLHSLRGLDDPLPPTLGLTILHIIAHGVGAMDGVILSGGDNTSIAPDALQAKLRGLLTACHVVYLDVCSGGSNSARDLEDSPGWQLAMSAGRVVLAPQRPLGTDAAEAMAKGFYRSLGLGCSLSRALGEGRDGVAALGIAHGSCRWWTLCAVVGDGSDLDLAPMIAMGEELKGWPVGEVEAMALLRGGLKLAEGSGYLGVEHLILALMEGPSSTPLPPTLKPFLRPLTESILVYRGAAGVSPVLSPRLKEIRGRLEVDFTLEALVKELLEVPWVQASLPMGARQAMGSEPHRSDGSTWTVELGDLKALKEALNSGLRMVVESGPEDGRELSFTHMGQRLGRFAEGAEVDPTSHALFLPPGPQDNGLSRRHLIFEGGSVVNLMAPGRLIRGGMESPVPKGPCALGLGDKLILGFGTHLRVVSI